MKLSAAAPNGAAVFVLRRSRLPARSVLLRLRRKGRPRRPAPARVSSPLIWLTAYVGLRSAGRGEAAGIWARTLDAVRH